jgi:isoamylase
VSAGSAGFRVRPGDPAPAGARASGAGCNFAIFAAQAEAASLQLYATAHDAVPLQTIVLDPAEQRSGDWWHVFVEGAPAGLWYSWRIARTGELLGATAELLDPWARAVSARPWRAAVVADAPYEWDGDRPLARAAEDSVVYELHVGGYTRHPTSGVTAPGTFAGLIEKIPYLVDLGITDVELLPVMAFDEHDVPAGTAALGLRNFWGYSPVAWYALHPGYAASGDPRREFRDLVKALHRAGIGVILDVAFNHTAEGGLAGQTLHFRRLANEVFYHVDAPIEPAAPGRYRDYSGCGNAVNCQHPLVAGIIVDCLEYWVREFHIDGFRFDLAAVLTRGPDGEPLAEPPLLAAIDASATLRGTRLIAEPWDAVGLYQVGSFPGRRWAEWNGRYRDTLRRAVRGDGGFVGELASCLAGSSELYAASARGPQHSINFVTCHDGFTLADLVSYERRWNEGNGEGNRDGSADNLSWNCGTEGPSTDPAIQSLRARQARNFMALLLLSQGVPMLYAGDELLRSQGGNNNAWCQDNPVGWFDWNLVAREGGFLRFCRALIALRTRHPSLRRQRFLTGESARGALPDISWHGSAASPPDWHDRDSRFLAFTLAATRDGEPHLHVIFNGDDARQAVVLPSVAPRRWRLAVDTSQPSPGDVIEPAAQLPLADERVTAGSRTVLVFEA